MAARGETPRGAPGGNLTTWLRENKPQSYLFIAARIVDSRDQRATESLARAASQVMDGVGLYMFRPVDVATPTVYEALEVPRDIELSAVLYRACQDIVGIQPFLVEASENPLLTLPGSDTAGTSEGLGHVGTE